MKIFLSWSGDKSHKVAKAFYDWIPCVIQMADPWISSKDIDRGSIWFSEVLDQVKDTNFGIVFVTKENQAKPWLLFESGALSKGLTDNRICTVLVDLNVRDIDQDSPFRQVNHTSLIKQSILDLVRTINKSVEAGHILEGRLEQTFNGMWPNLEDSLKEALVGDPAPMEPGRKDKDVLNDILENVLSINRKVSSPSFHGLHSKYIEQDMAKTLLTRLIAMGLDRKNILEITGDLIPVGYVNRYLGIPLVKLTSDDQEGG